MAVVLMAVAATIVVIAASSNDDDDGDAGGGNGLAAQPGVTDSGVGSQTVEGCQSDLPDGLELVECGYDVWDNPDTGDTNGGLGFIVANTTDEPLYNLAFPVTIYDTSGTLLTQRHDGYSRGFIAPGEEVGFGATLSDMDEANDWLPDGIGGLLVTAEEEPISPVAYSGSLDVSNVVVDDNVGLSVTFDVTSDIDTTVPYVAVHALYRDSAGEIVGGDAHMDFSDEFKDVEQGDVLSGNISTSWVPPDATEVEIYAGPGLATAR